MGSNEEYERNARDAEEWAQRSTSHEDRQSWLRIADGWLELLRKSEDVSPPPQAQRSAKRSEKCEPPKSKLEPTAGRGLMPFVASTPQQLRLERGG